VAAAIEEELKKKEELKKNNGGGGREDFRRIGICTLFSSPCRVAGQMTSEIIHLICPSSHVIIHHPCAAWICCFEWMTSCDYDYNLFFDFDLICNQTDSFPHVT